MKKIIFLLIAMFALNIFLATASAAEMDQSKNERHEQLLESKERFQNAKDERRENLVESQQRFKAAKDERREELIQSQERIQAVQSERRENSVRSKESELNLRRARYTEYQKLIERRSDAALKIRRENFSLQQELLERRANYVEFMQALEKRQVRYERIRDQLTDLRQKLVEYEKIAAEQGLENSTGFRLRKQVIERLIENFSSKLEQYQKFLITQ